MEKVTSTYGYCYCGGSIDFSKEIKTYKVILKIGDYKLTKYDRTMYWCPKCKKFK